jgi:hypothetical protein
LTIEVNAGKAEVNLCVKDLEGPAHVQHLHFRQSRNGPTQQKRIERHALARQEAEEVSGEEVEEVSGENKVMSDVAVEATATIVATE